MARINTEEAVRRSLADEHGGEDAAIAPSIIDEATRRHATAKRPANADTNEPHKPQRAQHNNTHASAQPTATRTNTIQLVPRKTDEPSSASLMAGDEQWPADDDGDAGAGLARISRRRPPPTQPIFTPRAVRGPHSTRENEPSHSQQTYLSRYTSMQYTRNTLYTPTHYTSQFCIPL